MTSAQTTVDPNEVAKFEAMSAEWWDPTGKFKPLHMMNPVRLDYITLKIAETFGRDRAGPRPFAGLRLLDIGCGGGLLSEPMVREALTDPPPGMQEVLHSSQETSPASLSAPGLASWATLNGIKR